MKIPMKILAASAALIVLAGCGANAETTGEGDPRTPTTAVETRTESYRTVEVDVPEDWGHTVGPTTRGDVLLDCGSPVPDKPAVGRPGMTSDACTTIELEEVEPSAPFVWLGVELEDGKRSAGDFVIETRTVAGVPVTVASDDEAERRAIIESAREIGEMDANGCTPTPREPGDLSVEGLGTIHGMAVCVYQGDALLGSWRRDADEAERFADAVYDRGAQRSECDSRVEVRVEIVVESDDDFGGPGAKQHPRFRINPMCGTVDEPHGTRVLLTADGVRSWHHELVGLHVPGINDGPLRDFFMVQMG